MPWLQSKVFNISAAGTTKYLCLKNVRQGYGIGAKHEYALLDWNANVQHKDKAFPAGVAVPVYFNWTGSVDGVRKNYGHIAVRLPDGRIWTDGRYYASIELLMSGYLAGGSPSYLGWGEEVNDVKVVENVNVPIGGNEDMIKAGDEDILRMIASEMKGWDFNNVHSGALDAREMAAWRGRDFRQLIREAWAEGGWYRNLKNAQAQFWYTYNTRIQELEGRPSQEKYDEVLADIASKGVALKKAEEEAKIAWDKANEASALYLAEKAKKSEDSELLDQAGNWFTKLFNRLFKK